MPIITPDMAQRALHSAGCLATVRSQIGEGSNHYIFRVSLDDGSPAICKFVRTRETENGIVPPNTDTLFGGRLSLERESYLFSMIRSTAGVPTPRVYGTYDSDFGRFLLVEAMPGISYKQFLRDSGYSLSAFLDSMRFLGHDFAQIQRVSFPTFGNVMSDSVIEPAGITNFADRWRQVVDMRLSSAEKKGALLSNELAYTQSFFYERLASMRSFHFAPECPPVLNFTDMHAENFFVDQSGCPSGYFDLESAQAAPAALEFYGFRFFLFNFFDEDAFSQAESAFFAGYTANGGLYAPQSTGGYELIDFLAACRLLELTSSYWGYVDGIRDCWGETMKALLFHYMGTGKVDYMSVGALWRQRDGQPEQPLKP